VVFSVFGGVEKANYKTSTTFKQKPKPKTARAWDRHVEVEKQIVSVFFLSFLLSLFFFFFP